MGSKAAQYYSVEGNERSRKPAEGEGRPTKLTKGGADGTYVISLFFIY